MTALIAEPPVSLRPLADRHGQPAALLLDAPVPVGEGAAPPPAELLRHLSKGSLRCYFRASQFEAVSAPLVGAGWRPLAAGQVHRADGELELTLPPGAALIEGEWFMAAPAKPVGAQVASRALALQLVQLVSADADTHEIEAVLRQDPTLSYHLLRLVNSLGMSTGRRVTSFSQAILILGRSQLRRWLNLMLFSAREGDRRSPMLLARVSVRARTMEMLAHHIGLGKNLQEQAFMVGMFSLLGVLFGLPLPEVLQPLTISDAMQGALLDRAGELGQLLSLVEAAERDDHAALAPQLRAWQIEADQFNQIAADAYLWMQSVAAGKGGAAGGGHA